MNSLAITFGTGLKHPSGIYTRVPPPPVDSLASMLARPEAEESWWSPHLWRDNRRASTAWMASSGIAVDIDYESDGEPFPEHRDALLDLATSGDLPGNLFHPTPHGARVIAMFESPCTDKDAVLAAATGFGERVAKAIAGSGYKVDEPVTRDLARLFFTPNAIAKGVKRHADVLVMRREPYQPKDLLPLEKPKEQPKPTPTKKPQRNQGITFDEAASEWNYDNRRTYPRYASECPVCHDKGSFGHLPDDDTRWYCFSTDHPEKVGRRDSEKGVHGDALDLECFESGRTRVEVLRRDGYLPEPRKREQEPQETPTPTAKSESINSEWQPPVRFDEFALPPFPVDALPPIVRDFVTAESEATQTPPDIAAMLCLTVMAAAAAKKGVATVKPGYSEPLNLFTVSVAGPGERKSQVFKDVTAPLERWEMKEKARTAAEVASSALKFRLSEKRLASLEAAITKCRSRDERDRLRMEAEEAAQEHSKLKQLEPPRFIADDSTPEALQSLMSNNGGRIAVLSPEGGVFNMLAGRYSELPNMDPYLKGHAGDNLRVDRKGRAAEYIENPALTIGLAVQPSIIERLAEKPEFRGTGLLARFLYSIPKTRVGTRATDSDPVPDTTRARWEHLIERMLSTKIDEPIDLRFSDEARQGWRELAGWIEPRLAEFAQMGDIQDWGLKISGAIVRIAALFSIFRINAQRSDLKSPIPIYVEVGEFYEACRIGKYLIPHAQAAFSVMGMDPKFSAAKQMLRCILKHRWTSFSRSQLQNALRGSERFRLAESLDKPIDMLMQRHFLRESPQSSGVGRPKTEYQVNPLSQCDNAENAG